jgi:hypothetical protein
VQTSITIINELPNDIPSGRRSAALNLRPKITSGIRPFYFLNQNGVVVFFGYKGEDWIQCSARKYAGESIEIALCSL